MLHISSAFKILDSPIDIVRRTLKRLHDYHVNLIPNGRENVKGCSVR